MKKILLLFSITSLGFLMNSCMEAGEQNYSGDRQFSYVTSDNAGLIYARNEGGFITSSVIKALQPGQCYLISYSWSTANGMLSTSEGYNVFNVVVTAEPELVPSTNLSMQDAPDGLTAPLMLSMPPYFDPSAYFGDHWAFAYQWKKKEGETATLRFYKSSTTVGTSNPDEVLVDVRLVKSGTATGTTEKTENGLIAANMSALRMALGNPSGTTIKNIPIRFRYYQEGQTQPTITSQTYNMSVGTN